MVLKLGHEAPVSSLDSATGKLVYAMNNEIVTANLRGTGAQVTLHLHLTVCPSVVSCLFLPFYFA